MIFDIDYDVSFIFIPDAYICLTPGSAIPIILLLAHGISPSYGADHNFAL